MGSKIAQIPLKMYLFQRFWTYHPLCLQILRGVATHEPQASTPGSGKPKWPDIINGCADDLPKQNLLKKSKELRI